MALSYAQQRRTVFASLTQSLFEVTTTLTDRGDLPDRGAFVKEIIDANDASLDQFVRVAEVGDVETWSLDRPTALARGDLLYRTSTLTVQYPTLSEAQAAAEFLVDKLNALVDTYQEFNGDFSADPGEVYALPQTNLAQLENLVSAYTAKVAERTAQTELVAQKETECAEYSAQASALSTQKSSLTLALNALRLAENALTSAQVEFTSVISVITNLEAAWASVESAIRTAGATAEADVLDGYLDPSTGTLMVARGSAATQQGLVANRVVDVQGAITYIEGTLAGLEGDIDANESAAAACATELSQLKSVQEALARGEQDLLDQIRTICPGYTP